MEVFKPFFINSPSEREKLACLCMSCLNTRNVFDALMIVARDNELETFDSISGYYLNNCDCTKDINGFYQLNCTEGRCDDCYKESITYQTVNQDMKCTYYNFEHVPINEKGSIAIQRVDHVVSFSDIKATVDKSRQTYFSPV